MKKYEIVSEYIEQLLNAGATELPPENVIASRLGVSRCPVRQAIRDFENRGLIVTMPGVGTFVRGADHPALRKLVRRNKRIGVVTFALLPSAAPMFMGIQNTLNAHGYTMQSVYELPVGNEPVRSTETIDGLAVDMIDGALVIPPNEFSVSHETLVRRLEEFRRESGLPVIVLERRLKGYSGSSVSIDNAAGSALAVEAFLAAGRKVIGYLGKTDYSVGAERFAGYKRALIENGFEPEPTLWANDTSGDAFIHNLPDFIAGNLPHILKHHPGCRSFVTFSYSVAYQAFRFLKRSGLWEDSFRFAGYDCVDGLDAEFYHCYSVIERPMYEVGANGCRLLLELIENNRPDEVILRRENPVLRMPGPAAKTAERKNEIFTYEAE